MYSPLQLIAILLTLAGCILLASSFRHQKYLCDKQSTRLQGWCILFGLIFFFIAGYLGLLWVLLTANKLETYHLLASGILFGGGIFVTLVIQMSRYTVSDVVKMAEKDHHNALHDSLTGLPNRTLLHERVDQAILHAKRNLTTSAIILLDLDRFKDVNDTLGHSVGDSLLQEVTPRITSCIRETDTVARIGGDEFVIVLPETHKEDAMRIAEKIRHNIDQSFQIDDHILNIGTSMGMAIYPYHGTETQTLLQHADIAMYKAKRNADNCVVYDVSDDEYSINRLALVSKVREAVREKSFDLVYQPKMNLSSRQITSVEALVRWHDIELGQVPPDDFIPIVEHIGLMKELTSWVIGQAILQQRAWHQRGLDMKIAVNVSANNLSDRQFPQDINALLENMGVETGRIILEITESSMMHNPDNALKLLTELNDMGISLSIDDFGTGYSSLAYLKNLPASEVKIDRSFVSGILEDENDAVIVYATISLLHSLGFTIVAEGVEDQDVLDTIGMWGCDFAQGYHVCRPRTAAEIFMFIMQHNQHHPHKNRRSNVCYI